MDAQEVKLYATIHFLMQCVSENIVATFESNICFLGAQAILNLLFSVGSTSLMIDPCSLSCNQ